MSTPTDPPTAPDADISAAQLAGWLAEVEAAARPILLDVREDHEWAAGHLPHAVHVPLGQLAARASEIDPQRPCVVYCRAGVRSAHGIEVLRQHGATQSLHNLDGGILAWQAADQPMIGGEPTNLG